MRVRTYRHSGECLLEVKTKGYRGRTEKHRQPHGAGSHRLDDASLAMIAQYADERVDPTLLQPVLTTDYRRSTLVHDSGAQRITCDTEMSFRGGCRWA